MKSYGKDILRTMSRSKKRFISIALIATLGVTMMCGLRAACVDLRYSADRFFDEQNLFDIRILSTLGLTDKDIHALQSLDDVEIADGGYSENVYTLIDEVKKSIEIRTLSNQGMNVPYLLEGKLPEKETEIVITKKYKNETGKGVGEQIDLVDEPEFLKSQHYTIVGIITDVLDINNPDGSMSFRANSATDYVGYVTPQAIESETYSVVYLKLKGLEQLNCYSDEYKEEVHMVVKEIEKSIKEDREQSRYEEIYNEAMEEWEEGRQEMLEEFAKADKEIADAKHDIWDGKHEISSARQELENGKAELIQGEDELNKQEALAEAEFEKAHEEIDAGYAEIQNAMEQYEMLLEAKDNLEARKEEMKESFPSYVAPEELMQLIIEGIMIEEGLRQFEANLPTLEAAKQELEVGEQELQKQEHLATEQFADARQEISAGWTEIEDGERKLAAAEKELIEGEKTLKENIAEYEEEKAKAEKELADALEEIEEIDMTAWYVQERSSLSGYANVESDADSIQAIGDIFPVLFLTVAILISLTTITRMVEEERGLIGTYKAMGFSNGEIRRKYLLYAAMACLLGGIIGDIGGYVILPAIIFVVFDVMYVLPEYWMQFDLLYGIGGIVLFEAGVVGATMYSCKKALKQVPAKLMRPKTPKSGSRVLLERMPFIWKHMSFLNKVTARNIFRYKKRMLMTVFGIAGCTALLLIAFTIKDTVAEMMPQQYEEVYQYDLMVVVQEEDYKETENLFVAETEIDSYVPARIETAEIINKEGKEESVQAIIVPEDETLEDYIKLKDKENKPVPLGEKDVLLTRNATRVLDIQIGDNIDLQTIDLEQETIQITGIVENYFGNVVYMTETMYRELFEEYEVNGMLVHFSESCENPKGYADDLKQYEYILSAVSTQAMKDDFETSFALINMVVYVILVLAALLAFVVLFTLSNINISERERELATIKVLGFYHPEVHSYVNKETWILTIIGILAGIPLGWILGRYVMGILKFPSLEFYIDLYPQSYLYAVAITLVFAFIVNAITNKSLDDINMVEALKSVE